MGPRWGGGGGRGGGKIIRSLRRSKGTTRQSNPRPPFVGELERLTHRKPQHPQPPGQILQRPDYRPLHLDRGPLAERVMGEIGPQRLGNAGCDLLMLGLLLSLWDLFSSLLGT